MRKKKIITLLIWCVVLVGVLFAVYFLSPDVKQTVDLKIATWRIEHKLEDKYGIEFEISKKGIVEGNEIWSYPVRYPKVDVRYTFRAYFKENGIEYPIYGIVDEEMNIIADSYAHYLYKDEMLQALTDTVSETVPVDMILAVSFMDFKEVLTLSKDTDSFEAFVEGTKTYEPLYLLVDESCSEEQRALVKETLEDKDFPFTVLITTAKADEIKVLRENNIRCFHEECEQAMELIDDFWSWLDNLEEYGEYYLWYEDEDVLYNADQYDKIIKRVE